MTILAYHGTGRLDFTRLRLRKASASQVDIAEARPFNIGLHFGTRAAAPTAARSTNRCDVRSW